MNARWQLIDNLFNQAVDQAPAERAVFLQAACGDDHVLFQEVWSLLECHQPEDTFLEKPAIESHSGLFSLPPTDIAGKRIGAYELLKEIGQGGMGAVFLAVRSDNQFQKQVAIKIIKRGMDTEFILRRFYSERQILASLEHPNIARLLDGGTTSDSLPYFVMEYIEGQPINAFCDLHSFSIHERLKLFRQVCSAVHYAHQNLIVHRDIKPGNILVASDGSPKLLDFGIAKLLSRREAGETNEATATELRLMTPDYASPEQIKGEPITTASDVYSLGVLLYELLTGHRPYRMKGRAPQEVIRAVLEEEPSKPSTAVDFIEERATADGEGRETISPETVSKTRDTDASKLRRQLAGDLDTIVLMALRKEPQRRYLSVEHFSEDIRRHLEGLPVLARKDTFAYRGGKFVKRHTFGVAVAALIIALLATGVVMINAQRARAERRFQEVRKLARAVVFDYHDEMAGLQGGTGLRQRMVRDALGYLDSLAQESGSDSSLQREIAEAYEKVGLTQGNSYDSHLGDTEGALASYRKSLEIRERLAATNPTDDELQSDLAKSYEGVGDMLYTVNNLNDTLETYERALVIRETLHQNQPGNIEYRSALATIHGKIGDVKGSYGLSNLGDVVGALEHYRKGLALREQVFATDPHRSEFAVRLGMTLANIGNLLWGNGDFVNAVEYGRRAVQILEAAVALEPDNADYRLELLSALNSLRYALVDTKQFDQAIRTMQRVLTELESMTAKDPKNAYLQRSLGVSYVAMGKTLLLTGDGAGAFESCKKALLLHESLVAIDPASSEHQFDLAITLQRLAEAQLLLRDHHKALAFYRRALHMREAMRAADPESLMVLDDLSITYAGIGNLYAAMGDLQGALEYLNRSLPIAEELCRLSPENVKWRERMAKRYFECGSIQAQIAKATQSAGRSHWLEARNGLQQSLMIFQDLRGKGLLSGEDSSKPEEAAREVARCDAALAKLR